MMTLLADGKTRSTSQLDMMFEDAREMPTTDAFGNPDCLLLAKQAEAFGRCFEAWNREFGEGSGSAGSWYSKAAGYYKEHAEIMTRCANTMWNKK